ncbi:GAK system CofD-like protein [Maridesulfovibrio sp.]|uniref:GAK system CofD-like protein n=1 Tax=Maridesulfovibrio sp. TaxID=2795000 RepID=UPI002A189C49|nr:GAK system CofD-like protein [Maridesulfovibrio sp.]
MANNNNPRIVFFSGGTALNGLAAELAAINRECSYIITTFDSGGSSALLRDLFDMPAVGDVRNRLLALADKASPERENIVRLLSTRLPDSRAISVPMEELLRLSTGTHPLMAGISDVTREILADRFSLFLDLAGDRFNPSGASLGNIILAAGFMAHQRVMAPPIAQFARLIRAGGTVRAATVDNGHLAVRLQNGDILAGQHLFTGKEIEPIHSPIAGMWICSGVNDPWPQAVHASSLALMLIENADLIIYPMGSFYSSILAALSPRGMGAAVAANPCPKIFIPNLGHDPELLEHDLELQVERLVEIIRLDTGAFTEREKILSGILIDSNRGHYPGGTGAELLKKLPVKVIDRNLISDQSEELLDPGLLAAEIMSLAEDG